ncbi:Pentatricopeptide repeat-containing protein, partial [Thalictrum thalictroides]
VMECTENPAPIAGSNLIVQETSFYNGHAQKPNSEVHESGGVFLNSQQSRANGYSNNQHKESVWNQCTSLGVQGNPNGDYGESGRSPQNLNGTYTDFVEESNKNKSGYQSQTIRDICHRESSVGFQQNPIGLQIGVGGSSTSINAKPDYKLPETCRYAGTIEELDTFCKEKKVKEALELLEILEKKGVTVDLPGYVLLIQACGNIGVLQFAKSSILYGIVPSMEHYTSVVKMLGSIGYLDEAMEFIEKMPVEPNSDIWETLMNLCGFHGNIELEDHCTKIVRYLDPSRLAEKSKEETSYHDNEIRKKSGLGEVPPRMVCEFKAGDKSFPEEKKIYALLKGVSAHMKEAGHLPSTGAVLHDVDEETKEEALLSHSERLAVAHGLIGTAPRQTIRIIKYLRVCVDCHNFLKVISKVVSRTFIVRDA